MRASTSTLVVALTTLLTTLSTLTSATHIPFGQPSSSLDFVARDASTLTAAREGTPLGHEEHTAPTVPRGARLTTLAVGSDSHELAVYWTRNPSNRAAKQAFVMIHGRNRNGNDYWSTMSTILSSAVSDGVSGADENAIVVAPQFYSAELNSGQYARDELAWSDINAWQAGEAAIHPRGAKESSFDALDAFFDEFSNTTKYPALEELVFVGHGGGGQLINRYSIVAKDMSSPSLHVRFVAGDPSSSAYFTTHRPTTDAAIATKEDCPLYNTWRYGFDNFTTTLQSPLTPQAYFTQAIARDVRYVIGNDDTAPNGDQYCMALLQGGVARRDRNLAWWKYIHYLARSNEDVDGFPGNLTREDLPDWSGAGVVRHTLTVIEGATHDADEVFGSDAGRTVLFERNAANVAVGWRPRGWSKASTVATTTTSARASAAGATGQTSSSSSSSTSTSGAMAKSSVGWSLRVGMLTLSAVSAIVLA